MEEPLSRNYTQAYLYTLRTLSRSQSCCHLCRVTGLNLLFWSGCSMSIHTQGRPLNNELRHMSSRNALQSLTVNDAIATRIYASNQANEGWLEECPLCFTIWRGMSALSPRRTFIPLVFAESLLAARMSERTGHSAKIARHSCLRMGLSRRIQTTCCKNTWSNACSCSISASASQLKSRLGTSMSSQLLYIICQCTAW